MRATKRLVPPKNEIRSVVGSGARGGRAGDRCIGLGSFVPSNWMDAPVDDS